MALQDAVELAELVELFPAEEAALAQGAVKSGGGMSLGEHKPVAVRILVVLGVDVHHVEIERHHRFRAGQRSARMARAGGGGHDDDVSPHLPRD